MQKVIIKDVVYKLLQRVEKKVGEEGKGKFSTVASDVLERSSKLKANVFYHNNFSIDKDTVHAGVVLAAVSDNKILVSLNYCTFDSLNARANWLTTIEIIESEIVTIVDYTEENKNSIESAKGIVNLLYNNLVNKYSDSKEYLISEVDKIKSMIDKTLDEDQSNIYTEFKDDGSLNGTWFYIDLKMKEKSYVRVKLNREKAVTASIAISVS